MTKLSAVALTVGLLAAALSAQESTQQKEEEKFIPADPQIAPIPQNASWTLNLSLKDRKGLNAVDSQGRAYIETAPRKIQVDMVGDTKRTIIAWENGKQEIHWTYKKHRISVVNGRPHIEPGSGSQNLPGLEQRWLSPTYLGTEWISADNFQKVDDFEGSEAYYYEYNPKEEAERQQEEMKVPEGAIPMYIPSASNVRSVKQKAWVSAETRLPLKVEIGADTYEFEHYTPPTSLSLPEELQEIWDIYYKRYKAFEAYRRARGY